MALVVGLYIGNTFSYTSFISIGIYWKRVIFSWCFSTFLFMYKSEKSFTSSTISPSVLISLFYMFIMLVICDTASVAALYFRRGLISPLMFWDQDCGKYHQLGSNAIYKNEDQIKYKLGKRKIWSSCVSEVLCNLQTFKFPCKDCPTNSWIWCMYGKLSWW